MYRAVTRNIEVVVKPRFVVNRSAPENNYFFWAYTISITNNGFGDGATQDQALAHYRRERAAWQEVRGAGVVGEEPVLKAGEAFEYTSGVPCADALGLHGWDIRYGHCGRRPFRHRRAGILARWHPKRSGDVN